MVGVLLAIVSLDAITAFVDQVGDVEGDYTVIEALYHSVLEIPGSLDEYLGFSALIGAMLGLGSFANSGELTVIRAAGYSLTRIGWKVMQPAFLLIIVGALINEFIAPDLEQLAESRRDILRGKVSGTIEETGLWIYDKGTYVHMGAVFPGGPVYGLSRYRLNETENELEVSYAEQARFDGVTWTEADAVWSKVTPELVTTGSYQLEFWDTDLTPDLLGMSVLDAEQLSARDLDEYSQYLGEQTRQAREYQVQFWIKILQPLSVAALVFVGISFVAGSNRQVSIGERIFVGVIVGVTFKVLQDILGPAATVWGYSPLLAVLGPTALIMLFGLLLIRIRQ